MGLPKGVEFSEGVTVVKARLELPRIRDVADDTDTNAAYYRSELSKVIAFVRFLEASLQEWKNSCLKVLELTKG